MKNQLQAQATDRQEILSCGSIIEHSPHNDRIYLVKTGSPVAPELPEALIRRAENCGFSKIFAKVPERQSKRFLAAGYLPEASVPGLFNRKDNALFMGYFLKKQRSKLSDPGALDAIVKLSRSKAAAASPTAMQELNLRKCGEDDVEEMSALYRKVFPVYPYAIHDPSYLLETMRKDSVYFGVSDKGKLAAISSAEMNPTYAFAEMTDFATLPGWRGNRLAEHLLALMESAVEKLGIKTVYTIARSASAGMNITFARAGYKFAGRLVNNTNISSGIESMNVWHKPLVPEPQAS